MTEKHRSISLEEQAQDAFFSAKLRIRTLEKNGMLVPAHLIINAKQADQWLTEHTSYWKSNYGFKKPKINYSTKGIK